MELYYYMFLYIIEKNMVTASYMCTPLSTVWWSSLSYFHISWSQSNSWPSQWLWWIMPGTVFCAWYLKNKSPKHCARIKWQLTNVLLYFFFKGNFSISRRVEKMVQAAFWREIQQIFGKYIDLIILCFKG